jgi:hypothetical protein
VTYGRFAWIKVFVNNTLDVHFLVFILKVIYCRTLSERVQGMACIFAVKSKKQNLVSFIQLILTFSTYPVTTLLFHVVKSVLITLS